MVVFEFETDWNAEKEVVYFIGNTTCTGEDKQHADEIYAQIDAQTSGLADE